MVVTMERWVGKVAVVTGASAGIGAAIAKILAENGMIVAGLARRPERVADLSKTLQNIKGQLHAFSCDVRKEEDILKAFKWVTENLGPVHVLVNNAGVLQQTSLSDGDTELWKNVLETNVLGLSICSREAIRIMKSNNIDGHIIHINSTLGHSVPAALYKLNMYPATKHAVTALTENLRLELAFEDSNIKVTSLSPGTTETEIFEAAGVEAENYNDSYIPNKILYGEDVADALVYILSTPPHVQIKELIIKPLAEKF